MAVTRSRCELAVGYTRFIASQSTGGDNNNKILEGRTPCAMVMYVMTPPVDICVRDHTPRASMYTCLYLLVGICVRDFRCQYVIYPYFYVI